jgi:hypothetical protein
LRKRRTAPDRRLRPAKAASANSPPPLLLLLVFVLVDEVEPAVEAELSGLVVPLVLGEAEPEVSPLVLGEAVEPEEPLVLPLGWLMLPELSGLELLGVWLLGVWLVDPVAPPVVELEPEVLGV